MCRQAPLHWILIEALRNCAAHGCLSQPLHQQLDDAQLLGVVALAPPLVDALHRQNRSSQLFAEPGCPRLMPLECALLNVLNQRSMNPFDCENGLDPWLERSSSSLIDDSLTRLADVLRMASRRRLRLRLDHQPDAAPTRHAVGSYLGGSDLGDSDHSGRSAIKAALNR
jgi:hypothetical protein